MSADDPNRADPASEVEIFRSPRKASGNHNSRTSIFGPEGCLYMAIGDGGPVNDPNGNGQTVETVLGKIPHIDIDHQDPGLNYAIPKNNPFVGVAGHEAKSGPSACAMSGGWPSIVRQAGSGLLMSAKTRGRRST